MTWCKSYDCRNSATDRTGYCVSCTQMLARADAYEDRWPSGSDEQAD
jgi:hypothetical protein